MCLVPPISSNHLTFRPLLSPQTAAHIPMPSCHSLSLSLSPLPHPLSLSLSLRPLPHLLFTYFFTHSSPPSYRDEICGKIAILELREKKERKKVREKSVVICPSGGKRSQAGMVDEGPREGWMGGCVDGERGVGTVAGREGLNRCRKLGACL